MFKNYYRLREFEMQQKSPAGFADYMATYGGHFSKKMCDWAVGMMTVDKEDEKREIVEEKLEPWSKDEVDDMLLRYGVTLDNDKGYDKVYVANMCKADYYEDSVPDETHVVRYIKNYLDDPDGYEEIAFNRFMMDCMSKDIPVMWEDMM